ncbi:MAG: serine/threonine protein kinase [Bacteroidales bacterium]|nr:serine/threonine protein kinase [Bacteroidales bacterium]
MINTSGFFGSVPDMQPPAHAGLELLQESQSGPYLLLKGHRNDRVVVYKCLQAGHKDDPVQQRILRREYEIGASLKHPGICEILDWVTLPGYGDAIEMEWIDGEPLDVWLSTHDDVALRTRVLCDICDALSYIHHKQVIHKDLKPENILITRSGGYAKILDFGLSDTDSILTGKGPAGTLKYAAPEVVEGCQADALSDIYSLGMIMKDMGPAFSKFARKCTRADREQRYISADELRSDLEHVGRRGSLTWSIFAALALIAGLVVWLALRRADPVEELFLDAVEQVRGASNRP